jgi:hypothetical protein
VSLTRIRAIVDIVWIRNTEGGEQLSPEMTLLMALVIYDDFLLFPSREAREDLSRLLSAAPAARFLHR